MTLNKTTYHLFSYGPLQIDIGWGERVVVTNVLC